MILANVLLVLAAFGFVVWYVSSVGPQLVTTFEACRAATSDAACYAGTTARDWVFIPLGAVIGALSLAVGVGVESHQRRARGYLLALAGFALLAYSWWLISQ